MSQTIQEFNIQEFDSDDYDAIARVHNAVYPDHPLTANELAKSDTDRDSKCRCERWVAEINSEVVAHGGFCQWPETFKEGEYSLMGGVMPEYRGKGIGSALFSIVMDRLIGLRASLVRSHSRADREVSIRFLEKRGFMEFMRERDWELDVATFDSSPYRDLIRRLKEEGIAIHSLAELVGDPDRNRKLYDLVHELLADTRMAHIHQKLPFDKWVNRSLNREDIPFEGYFVAIDGGAYVGKTHFETEESDDTLLTKLTGVLKSHRRRGIAVALKVASIEWARKQGHSRILTDNESNNTPVLALNERLGFKKLPEWIFYEKRLGDER